MTRSLTDAEIAALPPVGGASAIDTYKGRHVSALCRDLGHDCDATSEYVIATDAGTLVLRWRGNEFTPAPTAAAMAVGVVRAAASALRAAVIGDEVIVEPEEHARRLAVCGSCALWNRARERCRSCGCFMPTKAKLAASRCPRGKW